MEENRESDGRSRPSRKRTSSSSNKLDTPTSEEVTLINLCSLCVFYETLCEAIRQAKEKKLDSDLGDKLLTILPKECLACPEEMLVGFLDNYFLKRPNIGPLSPADCIGEKFENCRLFHIIKNQVTRKFPDTTGQFISKITSQWFFDQLKAFTAFDSLEIVVFQTPDALYRNKNHLEILLTRESKRYPETLVAGILDNIYNRFSVGFIYSWGAKGEKLSHLYVLIHDVVSQFFPETEDDLMYSELVRKWYRSKFPALNFDV